MSSYVRVVIILLCLTLGMTAGAGVGVGDWTVAQTTPPHVHPDEVEDDSDIESVNDQLAEYLLNSIRESTAALEEGNYDRARSAVGADYDRYLEQFQQVSRETGRANEAATFETVRDEQRRFVEATEAYNETYVEYQEARNAGNEQRARELARELEEHHRATQESGSALESEYERIEAFSDEEEEEEIDLDEERTAVRSIQENIDQRQENVQSIEFTETTLTVDADSTEVSFLDPLVLRGELRTAEGTPIANEEVTFVINGRETTVTTDLVGQFTLVHRPTTMPLDTEQVTVQYAPAVESTYLGSSATVPVSLEQVEPTIEVTDGPEETAFGEEVTVRGSVTADEAGAGDVPVAVEIGDQHLGTTTTDETGAYEMTTTLPAGVPAGENTVDVTIPVRDRALAGTSTSEPIAISETESDLTVGARPAGENEVEVTGRLTTADGQGIDNQSITVRIDGESVATLETAGDGTYEGVVPADHVDGTGERTEVEVVAVYDDDGNVGESRASTTTEMDLGEEPPGGLVGIVGVVFGSLLELLGIDVPDLDLGEQSFGLVHWLVLLAFAIGLPLGSYPLVQYFGSVDEDEPDTEDRERPREATPQSDIEPVTVSLEDARALLETDPKRAIQLAYTVVRADLAEDTTGIGTARTHREFYQVCRSNGFNDEDLAALKTLTDQYEHAAFANTTVSVEGARQAIDAARRITT